jgi:signal peptidase II
MAASLILILVVADQLMKALVEAGIAPDRQITVIDGFFSLVHVKNTGAAFSLFAGQTWSRVFLSAISFVVSMLLIRWIGKLSDKKAVGILSVILAGSLGNLIDRVRLGAVTDFLSFRFGPYSFPSFNVADICVTLGVIFLLLNVLFDKSFSERLLKAFNGVSDLPGESAAGEAEELP